MRNPFRHFCKSRGIPDYTVHHVEDHQNSNNQQTNASTLAAPLTPHSLVPAGYPTNTGAYDGYTHQQHAFELPIAYPSQQGENKAEWEFKAGNNINKKGQQKAGNIIVGNTSNGATLPVNLPQNGRFVFNAGSNTNEGDSQEVGSVEFANVH